MHIDTSSPDALSPPSSESTQAAPVLEPTPACPKPRHRVLIVDDLAADRTLLRILLEQHEEFEIVGEAGDGEEAVQFAEVYEPDIILMDVHLPRLNGVEATRRISRMFPAAVIIGISSQYSPYAYNAMTAAGAAAFVRKQDAVEFVYKTIQFSLHARRNGIAQVDQLTD